MDKETMIGFEKLNRAELETLTNMLNHASSSIMDAYAAGNGTQYVLLNELWPVYREVSTEFYSRTTPEMPAFIPAGDWYL